MRRQAQCRLLAGLVNAWHGVPEHLLFQFLLPDTPSKHPEAVSFVTSLWVLFPSPLSIIIYTARDSSMHLRDKQPPCSLASVMPRLPNTGALVFSIGF